MMINRPAAASKPCRRYRFIPPLFLGPGPLAPISELDELLISKSLDRTNLPGYISSDDTEGEGCDSEQESDSEVGRSYSPAVIKGGWHPAEIIEDSGSDSEEEAKGLKDIEFQERSLMAPKEIMFSYRRKTYQVAPKTIQASRSYSEGFRKK